MHFGDLFSKNSEFLFTVRSFVEEMALNSVMDFMIFPVISKCMKGSVQLGHQQLRLKFKHKEKKTIVLPELCTFNLTLPCKILVN